MISSSSTPSSRALVKVNALSLVVVVMLLAAPARADAQGICSDPANRTLNCDLAVGISGWVQEHGTTFSHAPEGHDGAGSIQIVSQATMGHEASISQCIGGLSGIDRLYYGAWFQIASGSVIDCGLSASLFTDDNCTTSAGWDGYHDQVLSTEWSWIGDRTDLDPSISAVRLYVSCYGGSGAFTTRIDDIYLGEDIGPLLFRDWFPHGDTSAWSATVP